jgi:hypothetical protein
MDSMAPAGEMKFAEGDRTVEEVLATCPSTNAARLARWQPLVRA